MEWNWPRRLAAITGLALLAACGTPEPIKLGFISGQTGRFADLGTEGLHGAILAVEWRNAQGGVRGRPVSLLIRDDQHRPDQARLAVQSLVKEDVAAIIGPMTSAMAVEMIPLANESQTVLMGGTIVTERVSARDDYFLRAIASTRLYAAFSAREHRRITQANRALVIYDLANREYAEDWARDYAAEFARIGGQPVKLVAFDSRTTLDVSQLVEGALAESPDLITLACSPGSAVNLIHGIRQRNPQVRLAGSAWTASTSLPDSAERAGEGMLVEQYHNIADQSERYRRFRDDYRTRFRRDPDYAAVISFDATNIVMDGLQANPDRASLKETLLKQGHFRGLQGDIVLDRYGDAERRAFMSEIRNLRYQALN